MNLPNAYLDSMKDLLGDEYACFINSYNNKSFNGLRVNTKKISVEDFVKIAPYNIEPIPFIDNGFYINEEDNWSKHPFYYAGLYYLQEPSAMLPANRLVIDEGDAVLDLCAAPGGKSTELSAKGASVLVSNDISYKRALPLVKNLEIAGAENIFVTCEEPAVLASKYPNSFDKILIDAPCSGEGMFRKDNDLIKAYELRGPYEYQPIQKEILNEAYKMLKPGGYMMYSTCTFSPVEDEEVIDDFLSGHEDIKLCDIDDADGFSYGYSKYISSNSKLSKCVHIFPHKMNGEGHFMTLMHKLNMENDAVHAFTTKMGMAKGNVKTCSYEKLPSEIKEFLGNYSEFGFLNYDKRQYIITSDGMVFALPYNAENYYIKGLRYLRTGLFVGYYTDKKGFTPHTAMALLTDSHNFINSIDFDVDDEYVYKYLKGETLVIPDDDMRIQGLKKGLCLIKVHGFGLGFAKYDGCKLKNMYEKGWRLI